MKVPNDHSYKASRLLRKKCYKKSVNHDQWSCLAMPSSDNTYCSLLFLSEVSFFTEFLSFKYVLVITYKSKQNN